MQPFGFDTCVPSERWTDAQRRQTNVPWLTMAHTVPFVPQSAHVAFSGRRRSFWSVAWACLSFFWIAARG